MSVSPTAQRLQDAITYRLRLEDNFKVKIRNRIKAILRILNDCRNASPGTASAGLLNIAEAELNNLIVMLEDDTNLNDAEVERVVQPLVDRDANNADTLRLVDPGRNVDAPERLVNLPPRQGQGRAPSGSSSGWFSGLSLPGFTKRAAPPTATPITAATAFTSPSGLPPPAYDEIDPYAELDARVDNTLNGVGTGATRTANSPATRLKPGMGGKRTRKYRRKA